MKCLVGSTFLLLVATLLIVSSPPALGVVYVRTDGNDANDGSGYAGVKVLAAGLNLPAEGASVQITGISSCEKPGTDLVRVLRVRTQSDSKVIPRPKP